MRALLVRRILLAAVTVLLVQTVTFIGLHLAPGDPVRLYLGPAADPSAALAMRHQLGLDRSLPVQYAEWLGRFVSGDWGTSIAAHRSVTSVLMGALGPTILLSGVSLLLTYVLGVAIGALQAARRRSRTDALLTTFTTALQSVPAYVLGLGLVLVFSYGAAVWRWLQFLRLPAIGASGIAPTSLARPAPPRRCGTCSSGDDARLDRRGLAALRPRDGDRSTAPALREIRPRAGERGRAPRPLRTALGPVITLAGSSFPRCSRGSCSWKRFSRGRAWDA
jgi:peptide/nickel transport system permease protein